MEKTNFLTTKDISNFFGVSTRAVCKWIKNGEICPTSTKARGRIGYYFTLDEFNRFYNEHSAGKEKRPCHKCVQKEAIILSSKRIVSLLREAAKETKNFNELMKKRYPRMDSNERIEMAGLRYRLHDDIYYFLDNEIYKIITCDELKNNHDI